ncbi:hypothetical protein PoB_001464900 [Plakobranchus ocellatus]|uniref:Uncharacterized protein n=1 Tax=Plakobranchus ocellatus TaxID=259542 RepID=A0AAV3Z165_9GAST|nr:hypothetical protein PoB_001464900 [Plakobranchus ocellatus]
MFQRKLWINSSSTKKVKTNKKGMVGYTLIELPMPMSSDMTICGYRQRLVALLHLTRNEMLAVCKRKKTIFDLVTMTMMCHLLFKGPSVIACFKRETYNNNMKDIPVNRDYMYCKRLTVKAMRLNPRISGVTL